MFVFALSAIFVQALIGANASYLPRGHGHPELVLPSPAIQSFPTFNTELVLPAPSLSIYDYASEIDILRTSPVLGAPELSYASSLPLFNQEFVSEVAYAPALPTYTQEISYTKPALPTYTQEISYTKPALPTYAQEISYTSSSLPLYASEVAYTSSALPVRAPEIALPHSHILSNPVLSTSGYSYGLNDLVVVGELPLGGFASVNGALPVSGALQFAGNVPAAGKVSVSCGCGNYHPSPIYY